MPKYPGVRKIKNLWYYRIQQYGKRIVSKGYRTAEEAHKARTEYLNSLHHLAVISNKITLKDFAKKYFAEHSRIKNRSSTIAKDEGIFENHILSVLGKMKLEDIKTYHLVQFQNSLIKNKTQSVAHNTMRTLRKILNKAVEWDFLTYSPLKGNLPPAPDTEHPVLTMAELFNLIDNIEGRDKYIVSMAGLAALRISEIFGLKWEDFNFVENKLHLRRQYVEGEIAPTKARKGFRGNILPIWSGLSQLMLEWKNICKSPEWVFEGRKKKPMAPSGWRSDEWQRIKKRFDLSEDFRFHDLRHTFATVMLADGAPAGDVQKLLRHKSIATTLNIYRHILPGQLESNFKIFNSRGGQLNGQPE